MDNVNNRIIELESELSRINAELERASGREQEYVEARSAMLLMLEDLNKATADIERAKNEWEATIDAISDPLFIHDKEFKVVRANKAYAEAGGMPFNEIIGKKYFEVFPKMDEPFKMCLKALELQEEEEVYLPSTDSIFKVRFYPIKAAEGKYLYSVHILEDITEIKRAEEKIKQEMEITSHLLASTLHDIGKIGTYEHLLDKPDKLTDEEFELIKAHPAKGAEILKQIKALKDVIPIVRAHHENTDGTGYPDGLKGNNIPLLARIVHVVDSFDAMTTDRPYRTSFDRGYALKELKRYAGAQFDTEVVKAFLKTGCKR